VKSVTVTKKQTKQVDGPDHRATHAPGGNGAAPETDISAEAATESVAVEETEVDLETAIEERDRYFEQLQRSVAEFANYRRRIDQEREQVREIANRILLAQILPVLDDLQRAVEASPEHPADQSWVDGIAHIERKFSGVLERAGVAPIGALGQPFDPSLHEAVATEPGSSGSTVVEVYQTGYRLGQSLLRPAMVKVGDVPASS
jgi:molecular chaperone GrpE